MNITKLDSIFGQQSHPDDIPPPDPIISAVISPKSTLKIPDTSPDKLLKIKENLLTLF
jgi:hypothetical protein